jgi:tetratricopeptide (TPR) repeat protein
MKTPIFIIVILVCLIASALTVLAQDEMQQFFADMETRYNAAEGDQARLDLCIEVLTKYPDTDYTRMIIGTAESHCSALDKLDEFILLAEKVQGQVESEEVKRWIDQRLLGVFGKTKKIDRLDNMAAKLSASGEENFNLYYDFIRAYTDAEQWAPIMKYAEKADPFANRDAYKKEYEDRDYSDEVLTKRGKNRKGLLLTYTGWALANTGDIETALKNFNDAGTMIMHAYTGQSDGKLDYFWGTTLIKAGKLDEALDRLAPLALYDGDEDAMALMKKAYIKKHGDDAKLDQFLKKQRVKFAKQIDDFTLKKYDGTELTLSSHKGKVIVLSFWFPT